MSDYRGAERWDALVVTLARRGGVPADKITVTAKHYADDSRGGTSRSILLLTNEVYAHDSNGAPLTRGGLIEINDTWWRKNDNVWTGWQVTVSNHEDIVTRQYPSAKARGPIADQVREALEKRVLR